MLDPIQSRVRQRRLLDLMQSRKLDAVVLGWQPNGYYFTGHLPFWQHHLGFILFSDGRSWLTTANTPDTQTAADEVIPYDATWMGTQRQDQPAIIAEEIAKVLTSRGARRIGIDASPVTAQLQLRQDERAVGIDEDLWQLRRRKDPDELALMKAAIECTRAMHERARQIIEPGIPEMRVFNELHAAAVSVAGEPLSAYLGNDYACGVPGGPPRNDRTAKAGELYILDLGPAYRGYFADNSRVYAVSRKLTDVQQRAYDVILGVFPIVERIARPGMRCREIFAAVNDHYRSAAGRDFPHHLGHGVGLQPHEFPHLNPKWDDTLQEGEVFTCEPGLYSEELAGGLRIENQYLVTAAGVRNLTPFPFECL